MAQPGQMAAPLKAFFGVAQQYFPSINKYQQRPETGYANLPDQGVPFIHQPQPQYASQCTYYQPKIEPRHSAARSRFHKLRRWVKIVSAVSTLCSGLFSLFMDGAMGYMMYKYCKTKNYSASEYNSPWPNNTKLWPTIMLFVASAITCLLSLAILIALCCRSKTKTMFSVLYSVVHIVAWVGVATFYRVGKSEDDLWGWSCNNSADRLQDLFKDQLNFSAMCKIQGSSWVVSIMEVGVKVVCSGGGFYFSRQQQGLKDKLASAIGDAALEDFDD